MREVLPETIAGARIIWQNPGSAVYELDAETAVELYFFPRSAEAIEKEKATAKRAFEQGIPVMFSFDVVRCGDRYGIIYENLQSGTLDELIVRDPGHFDKFVGDFSRVVHRLNSVRVGPGEYVPMRDLFLKFLRLTEETNAYTPEEIACVRGMLDAIPERDTLVIWDALPMVFRYYENELRLFSAQGFGCGHPIYSLSGTAFFVRDFAVYPDLASQIVKSSDMDPETRLRFWNAYLRACFAGLPQATIGKLEHCIAVFSLFHIFSIPGTYPQAPAKLTRTAIRICRSDLFPEIERWTAEMKDLRTLIW